MTLDADGLAALRRVHTACEGRGWKEQCEVCGLLAWGDGLAKARDEARSHYERERDARLYHVDEAHEFYNGMIKAEKERDALKVELEDKVRGRARG